MDYVIETDFEGPGFVAVPNHVIDRDDLSAEALGVLVWMARRPRGYIIRATAVQTHFRMGRDRWQRIARELRAAGAMRNHRLRDLATGRMAGEAAVIGWPKAPEQTPRRAAAPGAGKHGTRTTRHREPENTAPGPGNPAQVSRKTRPPIKDPHSAAREASPASQSGAGGAEREAIRARGPKAPAPTKAVEPPTADRCDGWTRARVAAELGQPWRHPETGDWHDPRRFPAQAETTGPARSPRSGDLA